MQADYSLARKNILLISPHEEDRTSLQHIFDDSSWKLHIAGTFLEAGRLLRCEPISVIISEVRLGERYCWKDLLRDLQKMASPPPLIVADRLADEMLWAEVLNLGACDLLMKPFDSDEVLRVVSMAHRAPGFCHGAQAAD